MHTITWFNELPESLIEVPTDTECLIWMVNTISLHSRPVEIRLHENARLQFYALTVLGRTHTVDSRITITHQGRHSFSRAQCKAVLFDTAELKLEPCVRIMKGARGADTHTILNTLLTGDGAKDTSIPSMEIDEQEVVAKHSATIGRIGDDELFYLQTRGLGERAAERCMISGFVRNFIERVPAANRETVSRLLKPYDIF